MSDQEYSGGFQDLIVWKEARLSRETISTICKTFPKEEQFRLIDQLKGPQEVLPPILQKDMADTITRKISSSADRQEEV